MIGIVAAQRLDAFAPEEGDDDEPATGSAHHSPNTAFNASPVSAERPCGTASD